MTLRISNQTANTQPDDALIVTVVCSNTRCSEVRARGELDVATAGLLALALEEQRAAKRRYVRLDLSGLTFMDCAGLSVILRAHHQLLADGGTLILTGASPRVQRVLHITALDEVLLTLTRIRGFDQS